MAKKISERRESASSLPARYAGAYRQLVHSLPFGLAVLHLVDPSDTSTWRLIAVNDAASRIAGSSVAGLLNLPLAARERGRGNIRAAWRKFAVMSRHPIGPLPRDI